MSARIREGNWARMPHTVTRRRVVVRVRRHEDDQGGYHYIPQWCEREASASEIRADMEAIVTSILDDPTKHDRAPEAPPAWEQWQKRGYDFEYYHREIIPDRLPGGSLLDVAWPQPGRWEEYGVPREVAKIVDLLHLHRNVCSDGDVERVDVAIRAALAPYCRPTPQ